jgi:hypothetical protein
MFAQFRQQLDYVPNNWLEDMEGERHAAREYANLSADGDLRALSREKLAQQDLGVSVAIGRCNVEP